jgi:release factor glutamine methyltransferase
VDTVPGALACARANVERLGLGARVRVLEGDLFAPLAEQLGPGAVDLIVANPPYLAAPGLADLPVEVRAWEPRVALDGGADGLDVVRRVLEGAPPWLRPGGRALVEIGEEHGPAVTALAEADPRYADVRVHRDFRGRVRIAETRRR